MRKKCVFGCATICALTSCGLGGNPAGPKPTLYRKKRKNTPNL